jgi:hypothetical protein
MAKADDTALAADSELGPEIEAVETVEAEPSEGFAWVTITKAGADQVHTGGPAGETLPRGARILVPVETAASLEARHFAEAD